jgi:predicted RNase H-like HicB family nuclease
MQYQVVLKKSDEGYAVWCPVLHGCFSQGATEAEALDNIREAIAEYLAAIEDATVRDRERDEVVRVVQVEEPARAEAAGR